MVRVDPYHQSIVPPQSLSRREFLGNLVTAATSPFALGLTDLFQLDKVFASGPSGFTIQSDYTVSPIVRSPKPIVILWMQGGGSQLETADLKPEAPDGIRGYYAPINSPALLNEGILISEKLPELARLIPEGCLIRTLHHETTCHNNATSAVLTGNPNLQNRGSVFFEPPTVDPFYVQVMKFRRSRNSPGLKIALGMNSNNERMPYGAVSSTNQNCHFIQCDFPRNSYDPLQDLAQTPREVNQARELLLSQVGRQDLQGSALVAYDQARADALEILHGPPGAAFNLNQEAGCIREEFGINPFGNSALTACRLVESGVPFVFLNDGFYDDHYDLKRNLDLRLPRFSKGAAALMRRLKDTAIIYWGTEFGRTPRLYPSRSSRYEAGREHWQKSFCGFLIGPGIRAGKIGRTNRTGTEIAEFPVEATLMPTTILRAAGYEATSIRTGERLPYLSEVIRAAA